MRMLKGESGALNFDQLMAQATQVAKQQDASLMERARQKRREEEERRRREEKEQRERENAQALLEKKRELQEKKQKLLMDQNKKSGVKSRTQVDKSKVRTTSSTKSTSQRKTTTVASFFPEKKKPVHMSFDELMKKAKEQSVAKGGKTEPKQPLPPKKYSAHDLKTHSNDNTPTLYHRLKRPEIARPTSSSSSITADGLSARERGKLLIAEPPKKLNLQKRDRRTIADVQREIRHNKGIHSDDEGDRPTRVDPRLMSKSRPLQGKSSSPPRRRMLSPTRPTKRAPERKPAAGPAPVRRMPFSGRPLDPSARRSLPPPKRRYREEDEEEDEELASFIVDDEDEYDDPRYARAPRRNSYSEEISKIFKYDKSRYANDPVYSDDDMEADARDVLLEEKRSERLAKREDYLEEQRELERLKKRKKNNA
ncbi:SPT2 chromatin protein-domain-containing protein [Thamnidium elegans]|nr:SPT2 chromatin protein-domain-containing protein [Thamnidium elegans]